MKPKKTNKSLKALLTCVCLWCAGLVQTTAADPYRLAYFDGHMHTTHSDGSGSIADIAQVARARGLDAVIVTNHTKQILDVAEWNEIVTQCAALSDPNFLMIPSFEVTGSEGLFCRDHVLAWGVTNPFVGDPNDALAPEEVWESPSNPFGTGPLYPDAIRRWTDWIHEQGGIAVHAHTTGTTQPSYNVDCIEVMNLSHVKDVARFAQMAGFDQARAWELGLLFNSFAVYGDKYLQMPVDMPNPAYGQPDQPATVTLPLQQALYVGTGMSGGLGENSGGAQWLGTPTPADLLAAGAQEAAALHSWDDLLMAYVNGQTDHPIFGLAHSDAHNTANTVIGDPNADDSDVGEARNGVLVESLSEEGIYSAVKAGRCFATTGPSLTFQVNDVQMGQTVQIGSGGIARIHLTGDAENANAVFVKVDIVRNGQVLQSLTPQTPTFDVTIEDAEPTNGYYRVELTTMDLTTNAYQFAWANPIFVKTGPAGM